MSTVTLNSWRLTPTPNHYMPHRAQPDRSPHHGVSAGETSGCTNTHSGTGEKKTLACLDVFKPITIVLGI